MKARHKRLVFLGIGMAGLGLVVWLVFNALGSNLSYFFSPTEVVQGKAPAGWDKPALGHSDNGCPHAGGPKAHNAVKEACHPEGVNGSHEEDTETENKGTGRNDPSGPEPIGQVSCEGRNGNV